MLVSNNFYKKARGWNERTGVRLIFRRSARHSRFVSILKWPDKSGRRRDGDGGGTIVAVARRRLAFVNKFRRTAH